MRELGDHTVGHVEFRVCPPKAPQLLHHVYALISRENLRVRCAALRSKNAEPNLGDFFARGRYEDAVPHLEKAAALGAGPDVYLRLAEVYARVGRTEASARAHQMYEQRLREFLRAPGRE